MKANARILLADSDGRSRRMLTGMLAAWGLQCTPTDQSRAISPLLRQEGFDLLLLDAELPNLDLDALTQLIECEQLPTTVVLLAEPAGGSASNKHSGVFEILSRQATDAQILDVLERAMQQHTRLTDAAWNTEGGHVQTIFDAVPDMIVLMNSSRRITHCNLRVAEYARMPRERLIGLDAHEVICRGSHAEPECPLGRAIQQGTNLKPSVRQTLGTSCFDIRSLPLLDRQGRTRGTVDVLHDVSGLMRAERAVRRRLDLEHLVVDIFNRFIGPVEFDQAILHALERVGRWSHASRAYLFLMSEDQRTIHNTHEWCAEGIPARQEQMQSIPIAQYHWLLARLVSNKTLMIDDVTQMPNQFHRDAAPAQSGDPRSLVAFPVQSGETVIGFLGLDNVETTREWSEEDRAILRMVSEVVSNALERRRSEIQHKLLVTAIEQSAEVILITAADGTIEYANPAFERSSGYRLEETLGHTPQDLIRSGVQSEQFFLSLWETLHKGEVWSGHFINRRKDGTIFEEDATISPVRDAEGHVVNYVAVKRDVTEKVKLEAQLHQAQKLESIGQLAAGIAHEINTPIQYVADNTRFLQEAFTDLTGLLKVYEQLLKAVQRENLCPELVGAVQAAVAAADVEFILTEMPRAAAQSLEGINRVARIVRAMKDFSHPGEQLIAGVDLNRAIESTSEVSRNEWKYLAEMVLDLDPALPKLTCYPGELNQALLNLIINAAHAIAESNKSRETAKGEIRIRTHADERTIFIRITDTGSGIAPEIRDKIFDPFFTTKEVGKGTGQGLAIVYSVVCDKHHGRITFETQCGQGTTFILELPIEQPSPAPMRAMASQAFPLPEPVLTGGILR